MTKFNATNQKIANSLKEVMREKPFDKITISDITENCSINRLTFYYHFKDKYDLLNAICYNEIISKLSDAGDKESLKNGFIALFKTMQEEKDFYANAFLCNNSKLDELILDYFKKFVNFINQSSQNEQHYSERDLYVFSIFLASGCKGVLTQWVKDGMPGRPEDLTNRLISLLDAQNAN